jgi:UDP-N-acetylmuramoyl-tripeptide--D-alanyl-D-alanine ligase
MKLPLSRIAEFLNVSLDRDAVDASALATGYSIDSRTIGPGELFFAVKGEKLDGHDFVDHALERGAVAAVVSQEHFSSANARVGAALQARPSHAGSRLLMVDNTLLALQTLATAVRRLWGKSLVGVTGSTGKTTTKEAVARVLAARYRVHKSEGNLNNHFGLPLMLLKLEPEHDIAVVEMGMSHAGEIAALARIAQPELGVVTNVAPVHLEFFDSIAGIARAKYELIESLPPTGTAVLNCDDEYVSQFGRNFKGKVVTYGTGAPALLRAEKIQSHGQEGSTFEVVFGEGRERVTLPLIGEHNVYNALAAIAVGLEAGLTLSQAAAALASLTAAEKRGEVVQVGNITVINDCYNCNPTALRAMTDALANMPAKRRIVVAGEMLELGGSAEELHRDCGRYMATKKIDFLLGVRGAARHMVEAAAESGMPAEFVATPEEAGEWLGRETSDGDVVLMKASRGVKLEKALETWRAAVNGVESTTGGRQRATK